MSSLRALLLLAFLGLPQAGEATPASAVADRLVREGIAIDLAIEPLRPGAGMREGENAAFRFTVTDTTTGTPLAGVYPAAWMDLVAEDEAIDAGRCVERVEELIGGSLLAQAELDLNVYYVLALNDDATISVVDPLFGFGGTKLLALISLASPGEDWVLTGDRSRVFVTQPEAGRVAAISTATWEVSAQVDTGPRSTRLALQGDGAYLWVGIDGDGAGSGVAVVDAETLEVAARIATGRGRHEIALTAGDRLALVTNSADGTVSVIDVRRLALVRNLETGVEPVSIDVSSAAGAAYVTHRGDGQIVAIDGDGEIAGRIPAKPGLGRIRFAPGGRFGFALNPEHDTVDIVDAARNRIVQTGDLLAAPDQVSFSEFLAYVRHRDSEIVLIVPLDGIGREGAPLPVVDFPGGQEPFGRGRRPSPADAIVMAPGATAVLVANPADRMIYFYKEGMAAPMGGFRNYDRQPRAVLVVDRSLRDRRRPGVYETVARLRSPGRYRLAFFLDTPRVVHCFAVEVAPDPELERARRAARPVVVEPLFDAGEVAVGEPVELRFRLTDPATGEPAAGLGDVQVQTYRTSNWKERRRAAEIGGGVYAVRFTPPAPGTYFVVVECLSQRLPFHLSPRIALYAVAPAAAGGAPAAER